jgi:uncharacterized protein (TIGR00299 family) protein
MTLAIRLDAVGGVAGDMFVAAMVDALPELRGRVLGDAAAVLPPGVGTPLFEPGTSAGLHCLRFRLSAPVGDRHQHAHAGFRDMVARIEAVPLSEGTAVRATTMLRLLAEAEAAIHHVPVDEVHFHEIGDWDSLMDVTAAGSIAAALGGARWSVSALPRGDGLVRTRHGLLPVPAPATVRLLEGFIWRDDGIGGERVTPTGAAILRHLVGKPEARVGGRLRGTGTGAGTRELPGQPNILRVALFEDTAEGPAEEDVVVLCFEIDDMTAEEVGVAADRLRATAGVRDVVLTPGIGKKGRPVQTFRLLVEPGQREAVAEACFTETSTIGLRWHEARRAVLPRVVSELGSVRVKTVIRPSGPSSKAENDDLGGIPGLEARRAAKRAAEAP